MKKTLLTLLSLASALVFAQEPEQQEQKVQVGGFIRYSAFYDFSEVSQTRDYEVPLLPSRKDSLGLYADDRFNMLAISSRVFVQVSGKDAFGAKVSGKIEADFLGPGSADLVQLFRLRNAYIKMDWQRSSLMLGQFFHPFFVLNCYPGSLVFYNVGFCPLNRSAQARYTYQLGKLDITMAALTDGPFASKAPAFAQQNAAAPEAVLQLNYKTDLFSAGASGGFKMLRPRDITDSLGLYTNETVNSLYSEVHASLSLSNTTVKVQSAFGQNMSHLRMLGGYGKEDNTLDNYTYSNLSGVTSWIDLNHKINNANVGVFASYIKNLGATDTYTPIPGASFFDYLESAFRVSPRISFVSGNLQLGIENIITGASYISFNDKGMYDVDTNFKPNNTDDLVISNRLMFVAKYTFKSK